MSVSRHTTSRPERCAEVEHRLGERAGVVDRLHERAVADLGVDHDRLGAAGDLLRHDARRDQRVVVHGRGHVAQRVQLLVGRDEVRARADDRHPGVADLRHELVGRELDAEARNRLELVERPAGFRVELSTDEFVAQVRDAGMAIIGASGNLVPADKKLYALRDVTATVDNYSLIAASIMSKKITAARTPIDAKVRDGAFMKSIEDARTLAEAMLDLGARSEHEVVSS